MIAPNHLKKACWVVAVACIVLGTIFILYRTDREFRASTDQVVIRVFGDSLDHQSRKLAGSTAVDCGRVQAGADATQASNCALNAYDRKQPFQVRYDMQGIDSAVSAALVFNRESELYEFMFDGDPNGQGDVSLFRQRTVIHQCPKPLSLTVTAKDVTRHFHAGLNSIRASGTNHGTTTR